MKAQKKKALSVFLLLTVLVSAGSQAVPAFAVDADGTALSNTTDDALTLPGERIYQIMTDRFLTAIPPIMPQARRSATRRLPLYGDNANEMVVFLDNHARNRFLTEAGGNVEKLQNALTFLFTVRGVPVVFQGTEQNRGNMYHDLLGRIFIS